MSKATTDDYFIVSGVIIVGKPGCQPRGCHMSNKQIKSLHDTGKKNN